MPAKDVLPGSITPCGNRARKKIRDFSVNGPLRRVINPQDREKVWHIPNTRLSGNAH